MTVIFATFLVAVRVFLHTLDTQFGQSALPQKQNENIEQSHTKRLQRTTCLATTNALAFCNKQVSKVGQSSGGLKHQGKTRKKLTEKRTNFGTTIAFVCYLWYNIFIEIWRKN